MEELLESARAYLAGLEAERRAALALSEQKAEEAKLIKARQEGFQAAMEILCGKAPGDNFGSDRPRASAAGLRSDPEEPRRRGRRPATRQQDGWGGAYAKYSFVHSPRRRSLLCSGHKPRRIPWPARNGARR
jgi:hypothetical protein